jgi:hypothetical protein
MAVRFYCEKSEMISGIALNAQAVFDPYVGLEEVVDGVK